MKIAAISDIHVFSQLGWGSVATGVVLLLLIPMLRKLINYIDRAEETAGKVALADAGAN